jgi:hypothetical protein
MEALALVGYYKNGSLSGVEQGFSPAKRADKHSALAAEVLSFTGAAE